MASQLEQLKQFTTVVADTGDFQSIQKFQPQDATTNPSLVYQATRLPQYHSLVEEAIQYAIQKNSNKEHLSAAVEDAMDKLFVNFGVEILKIVKGRVSTEIDARFSFDSKKTVEKAKKIISLYEQAGIPKERVLIKIASTWEGTVAAKELEEQGIHVNMTLMFSKIQALAAAQYAKATLISPFVGRILDWYKEHDSKEQQAKYLQDASQDPGVKSVKEIYEYYKKFDIPTVIMGASFRNKDEITELAGIDLLTISPALLKELDDNKTQNLEKKLDVAKAKASNHQFIPEITESLFRWELNENAMATEKLAEGIRKFAQDTVKLEQEVRAKIESHFK